MTLRFVDLQAQYRTIKADIDARIQAVIEHGSYILGPEVAQLEAELARFAGVDHAVGVANGTDALQIALMIEGVGPGDAVFLPAFTFTATAEVIALLGATPVFVDVDPRFFNIDPDDLDNKIGVISRQGRLRPRCAISVDLFGQPADYRRLGPIIERHGLRLIADAAQSFGAALDGRRVGSFAPITTTS